jgi:hypothetical protein
MMDASHAHEGHEQAGTSQLVILIHTPHDASTI